MAGSTRKRYFKRLSMNGEWPIPVLQPPWNNEYFGQYNLSDIIGGASNIRIEDNTVVADVEPLKGNEKYFIDEISVVSSGIGEISDEGVIKNYHITAFMLTNDPA